MKKNNPISKLQRYWQGWADVLKPLINDRTGARLFFPPQLTQTEPDAKREYFVIQPTDPIFIYNAPTKASSSRSSASSTKLAIFIDGCFNILDTTAHPYLHSAECSVSFFKCHEEKESVTLELFDAVHFDFERPDAQTPFHPIFHAQRGQSRTVTSERVQQILSERLRKPLDKITVNSPDHLVLGTPYLRLPTPQLDIFSVVTLVMADFFCNGGQINTRGSTVLQSFKAVLSHLQAETNLARECTAAATLKARINKSHLTTAHWYAENG